MNKKEQAEMQKMRDDLALARAMRWPDYPKPAPMSRDEIKAKLVEGGIQFGRRQMVARGWFYNAYLGWYSAPRATYGCSDGLNHNSEGDTTSTQNVGRLFVTQSDALRALRLDLTEQCARVLAAVDRQIADADNAALSPEAPKPEAKEARE